MSKPNLRALFLEGLNDRALRRLRFDWPVWARSNQSPPLSDWRTWLLLGGRGSGKTRTGAQWLNGVALADPHFPGNSGGRVALVGTNYEDIRDVMVEGESGLLAVSDRRSRPDWISSRRELVWPNGVIGKLFSSSDPEGLRGSQFGASWSDEVCKWSQPEETWDMLQFCLRLGDLPRQVVTTTPKPMKLLRKLIEDPTTVTTRSRTKDNAANLAEGFMAHIEQSYGNTRLGRQELDGELIEDREDALWSRDMIDAARVTHAPELGRIVVAVDPPAGSANGGASCGIVAAGMAQEGACYVLADKTMATAKPHQWAGEVVRLFRTLNADCVIAEVNQGGDMVRSVLTAADPAIPVRSVHASRGKWLRAEPVALMYERGIIHHVGQYPDLEDQMCALAPDGKANGVSPDRVDALVWAISELAILRRPKPRVRPV